MAELLAVRAGRRAGFLRDRKGHIHARAESAAGSSLDAASPSSQPTEASVGAA